MNVYFLLLLPVFLAVYLRRVSPVRLLQRLGARPVEATSVWENVNQRFAEVARRHRVPAPQLWILPEFSPNALVLRPGREVQVALSEGIVRALDEEELDCVFSLCLAHGHQRGRWWQTWVGCLFFPVAQLIQGYPLPAQLLLSPVVSCLLRSTIRSSFFLKADRIAAEFQTQWKIAAALQKLGVVGRKIPLRRWNLALDSMFLVSPLALDNTPIWAFQAQPTVEARRRFLLGGPACESAASLP
jgi:Zn-dependent protease with chaperone function